MFNSDGSLLMDTLKSIVKEEHQVAHNTPYCQQWVKSHKNCKGCESERGCSTLCKMMAIVAKVGIDLHSSGEVTESNAMAASMATIAVLKKILKDSVDQNVDPDFSDLMKKMDM
jgi:hypothetical protein